MAHTTEQRSARPLCGARKKNGDLCRAFAGQGTEHAGIGKCKNHGGATASHKQHAVTVEAKRRMIKLGAPVTEIEPHQALLALLRATAGHVAWLHREIAAIDDLSAHESRVMVALYDGERDRLARIAKSCSEVGVAEHEVRIHEREAAIFAVAVDKAAEALGLTTDERRQLHELVAAELDSGNASAVSDASLREPGAVYGA